MRAHHIFFCADGSLRAPWRIAVFLAAAVGSAIIGVALVSPAMAPVGRALGFPDDLNRSWALSCGLLFGLAAAHLVSLWFVDRRPLAEVGLDRSAARPAAWMFGFAVGGLAIAIPITVLIASRWLDPAPAPEGSSIAAGLRMAAFLLPAALSEELAFRGYLFSVLRKGIGLAATLALTSIVFGAVHVENPGSSMGPLVLVSLAGVFLAAVLVTTRSLYAAWMAHFAWNWTIAALFHAPVSGFTLEAPDYRFIDGGPDWATGGVWGPEGGVPAGLGMIAGTAYLFARRLRRKES